LTKTNFELHREEKLSNPEFRKKYEALEPKYELIRAIIRRRNELHLSQTQLANIIGMQQPAISRLENGVNNTNIGTLFKVIDALKLNIEFKPKNSLELSNPS
jgi:transcriptional regulator with XRE-family HTH domain